MNYSMLSVYFLSVFLLIATPGPVVALILNTSSRFGSQRALLTAFGSNGASLCLVAVATAIVAGSVSISPAMLNGLSCAGCLFTAFVSARGLRSTFTTTARAEATDTSAALLCQGGFLTGFLVGISNPNDIVFFVSFFPQFVRITNSLSDSIAVLVVCYVVLDVGIMSSYVFLMRQSFARRHHRNIAVLSSGLLLVISASGLIYSGSRLVFTFP